MIPSHDTATTATPRPREALAATAAAIGCLVLSAVFVFHAVFDGGLLDGGLVNSDTMILPQIHWNMIHRTDGWFAQQQARLIGIVPDQILHHALAQGLGDVRLVLPSLVTATLFAEIGLGTAIVVRTTGARPLAAWTVTTLVFLAAGLLTLDWPLHAQIAAPINHSGGFVLSLVVALLVGRGPRDPLVLALIAVGCLSDTLFVALAVVPWVVARLAIDPPERWTPRALRPFRPVAIAAVMGIAGQVFIFHQTNRAPPPTAILDFLRDLTRDGRLATVVAITIVALCAIALRLWRRTDADETARAVDAFALVAMGSSAAAMVVFYVDYWSLRYAWPAVGWPLILLARELAPRASGFTIAAGWIAAGATAVVLVVDDHGRPPFLDWRDDEEVCVSRLVAAEGLNAGLAGYWHARRLVVSSNHALKIEQVNKAGVARLWGNDPYWFLHDHRRADGGVRYDFVLTADLDTDTIAAAYGRPDEVRRCPGSDVWIWRDPDHLLPILVERSADTLRRIVHPERR
jgi:hypothetical protein